MSVDREAKGEQRKQAAARGKLAGRALSLAVICWVVAVFLLPLGVAGNLTLAPSGMRFPLSYGLAAISLGAALVAIVALRPWTRWRMRTAALTLLALTIILGDVYILSLQFRL